MALGLFGFFAVAGMVRPVRRLPGALRQGQQVGHEHASTTAIYTCVSSDFRTRTLRRALDTTVAQALAAVAAKGGPS
ncbi:hypothetical protein ACFQVD_03310 [Streptosporangium amethystogenes subsp. fukuiense]|uniref:Secreted protein n=1 Tax=Streptosporangium amethystogenes subsp. fukuiense TaxID=698418 RepID=A0ABW2SUD9_9ACTN